MQYQFGYPPVNSDFVDESFPTVTMEGKGLPSNGILREWEFYTRGSPHEIYLQVWRPLPEANLTFTLVGQTVFHDAAHIGYKVIELAPSNGIICKAGDVIGFHHIEKSPIPFIFKKEPCGDYGYVYQAPFSELPSLPQIGDNITTQLAKWTSCRRYSVRATIEEGKHNY